jgi:hypothetical protein
MIREQANAVLERPTPLTPPAEPAAPQDNDDPLAALHRIERLLFEIHGRLETTERAQRHQEFSLGRLVGALLQVLVVVVVLSAVADWVFQTPPGGQLVKLAFAGVLQIGVLTAFMLVREDRR